MWTEGTASTVDRWEYYVDEETEAIIEIEEYDEQPHGEVDLRVLEPVESGEFEPIEEVRHDCRYDAVADAANIMHHYSQHGEFGRYREDLDP